jgi:hypothetical protein
MRFFNEKTLGYLFDNQAFVDFIPPQYFTILAQKSALHTLYSPLDF